MKRQDAASTLQLALRDVFLHLLDAVLNRAQGIGPGVKVLLDVSHVPADLGELLVPGVVPLRPGRCWGRLASGGAGVACFTFVEAVTDGTIGRAGSVPVRNVHMVAMATSTDAASAAAAAGRSQRRARPGRRHGPSPAGRLDRRVGRLEQPPEGRSTPRPTTRVPGPGRSAFAPGRPSLAPASVPICPGPRSWGLLHQQLPQRFQTPPAVAQGRIQRTTNCRGDLGETHLTVIPQQ